jgi:hypothetical protein
MECVYNSDGIRYESKHKETNVNKKKLDVTLQTKDYEQDNYNILKKDYNIEELKKLLLNYSC